MLVMPVTFDWTVNIGQIFTALGVLIGGVYAISNVRWGQEEQGRRLAAVEDELKKLSELIVANARLDERVNNLRAELTAAVLRMTALETDRRAR